MENEFKMSVELLNVDLLDFKTSDGQVIQGLKIYYINSEAKSDNNIIGKIENKFISSDKLSTYKETFIKLKDYYIDSTRVGNRPMIDLYFSIKSINSMPSLSKISIQ